MGESGRVWSAALPGLIADLEREWSVMVGRPIPGGSASYVARAVRADGSVAVLKIALIADGWAEQVATLARADGQGYARLFEVDLPRRASAGAPAGPGNHGRHRRPVALPRDALPRPADAGQARPPGLTRPPVAGYSLKRGPDGRPCRGVIDHAWRTPVVAPPNDGSW